MFRYLSGASLNNPAVVALGESHQLGAMLNPRSYNPAVAARYPVAAVDNGCFTDRWDEAQWIGYLDRCPRSVLFAVAPDVPFDWEASWARSRRYVDEIRDMGFRVAVAVQNGATADTVPWSAMDAVFLGGDTAWKLGTEALYIAREATHRGVHVHMGRANSARRIVRAISMSCDSADGTYLRYGEPELMAARLAAMIDHAHRADGHQLALA